MAEALRELSAVREAHSEPSLLADAGKTPLRLNISTGDGTASDGGCCNLPQAGPAWTLVIAITHSERPERALMELDKIRLTSQGRLLFAAGLKCSTHLDGSRKRPGRTKGFQTAPPGPTSIIRVLSFFSNTTSLRAQRLSSRLSALFQMHQNFLIQAITLELLKKRKKQETLSPRYNLAGQNGTALFDPRIILEIHLFSEEAKTQLKTPSFLGVGDLRLTTTCPGTSYTNPEDTTAI